MKKPSFDQIKAKVFRQRYAMEQMNRVLQKIKEKRQQDVLNHFKEQFYSQLQLNQNYAAFSLFQSMNDIFERHVKDDM